MYEIELSKPQSQFVDLDAKYPLFVAGFGSGKSTTQCVSIFNDFNIPHYGVMKIGAYAPTYDLLKLITIPYLCEFLEEMRIGFKLNKSDYILTMEDGDQIILRSLDNPARIVGYQTFRAHIDEIDTLPQKKASEAWNKVIARNRQMIPMLNIEDIKDGKLQPFRHTEQIVDDFGNVLADVGSPIVHLNRVSAYTTPEGFSFAYHRWEKDPVDGYVKVKASTYSNIKNLPPDYIDGLYRTYPAGLIDAYIDGEFVNLVGKSVYPKFDRHLHHTDEEVQDGDILYVGMDFNVVHGASVVHVLRFDEELGEDIPHAVDEIHDAYDTDEQIEILEQRYPKRTINVYPDATGDRRTSANTTESDIAKLKNAGFHVFHDYSNPPIKDRVMSYNAMIMNGKKQIRYKVNTKKCPNLTNSLEQQIWSENGLPDKSTGLDHIVDAPGYYVFYNFGITKPTAGVTRIFARY